MATETLTDIAVTSAWQNVVTTHAAAASRDVLIQNRGEDDIEAVAGGASVPVGKSGVNLNRDESVIFSSAGNIWLRCSVAGVVSITLL